MNQINTTKINANIYAIRTKIVNMFVFTDGIDSICFDAGCSPDILEKELEKLNIQPDTIKHVFLTHSCYDHTGGIELFKNAKVYLNRNEEQMINGKTARAFFFYHNPKIEKEYQLIDNGEEINIGSIKVKAIETPGHTPGSTSYLVNDTVLFTGDTIAIKNGKIRASSRIQNMDTGLQRESIRKLAKLKNVSAVFTAHYGFSTDYDTAISDWR